MADPTDDEIVADYRRRIVEAERHNRSAADALLRELAAILSARAIAAAACAGPAVPPPNPRYCIPWSRK